MDAYAIKAEALRLAILDNDRLQADLAAARAEIAAAQLVLPACCGSLADAADTLRQDRDAEKQRADGLAAERDALKAQRDELLRAAKAVAVIDCDPFAQGGLAAELQLRNAIAAVERAQAQGGAQ